MTYKEFWNLFRKEKKALEKSFKKQDQFDVGYHLGILHTLRQYGTTELGIPFSRLDLTKECN